MMKTIGLNIGGLGNDLPRSLRVFWKHLAIIVQLEDNHGLIAYIHPHVHRRGHAVRFSDINYPITTSMTRRGEGGQLDWKDTPSTPLLPPYYGRGAMPPIL